MARTVITVDGLAGTGKTTLSELLASKLGYACLSSGALYRAIGYLALQQGVNLDDGGAVAKQVRSHSIELHRDQAGNVSVLLDGSDIGDLIRSPEVSEATSKTSRHAEVRDLILDLQRNAFHAENLVAEGRDMGTVVFPDAACKFFIEVDQDVRIERRMAQLAKESPSSFEKAMTDKAQIGKEILERDQRDRTRSVAPCVPANDAIFIDNSGSSLDQQLDQMLSAVRAKVV